MAINPRTITAASATYTLTIPGVFSTPQTLQGYSTDAAFDTSASSPTQVQMGVDGVMSAGFVPFTTEQTINLQADSSSGFIFETWLAAMVAANEVFLAYGVIILPGMRRTYTLNKGALTSGQIIPGTRKILQPRAFTITWERITGANL